MNKALAHTSWECKYHVVFVPKMSVISLTDGPSFNLFDG